MTGDACYAKLNTCQGLGFILFGSLLVKKTNKGEEIYVKLAVEDYNNRPYTALNGLTPTEVLNGKQPNNVSYYTQTKEASQQRILENKIAKCCAFRC